jgi:hypothetical protein
VASRTQFKPGRFPLDECRQIDKCRWTTTFTLQEFSHELRLSDSDGQMRLAVDDLQQAAQAILPNPSDSCAIQIIPFETTLILDTRDHLQPQALLRIRITHCRGLDQPAGPAEARTLKDVEEKLQALGVQAGGSALV